MQQSFFISLMFSHRRRTWSEKQDCLEAVPWSYLPELHECAVSLRIQAINLLLTVPCFSWSQFNLNLFPSSLFERHADKTDTTGMAVSLPQSSLEECRSYLIFDHCLGHITPFSPQLSVCLECAGLSCVTYLFSPLGFIVSSVCSAWKGLTTLQPSDFSLSLSIPWSYIPLCSLRLP